MKKKRACVISGGGSWGAYGGGTLARLDNEYDVVVGVSTGSLLAPLTALREWDSLKMGYTNVDSNDIFDKCWYKGRPLTKDGKLKKFPIMMTLLMGQKSICTSNALRRTIDKFFPEEYYNELRKQRKEILVGTQNFSEKPSKIHYFSSMDENYDDFKDWVWCSANFPFFTTLVKKSWRDGGGSFHVGSWSDGGLTDLVGLDQLKMRGYNEIDIVLHRRKDAIRFEGNRIHNLMENVTTSIDAMRYDIEFEYFYEKIRKLNKGGAKVTVYWLPRRLSNNSMVFNKKEMSAWWDEGYETALDSCRTEIFEPIKKRF